MNRSVDIRIDCLKICPQKIGGLTMQWLNKIGSTVLTCHQTQNVGLVKTRRVGLVNYTS